MPNRTSCSRTAITAARQSSRARSPKTPPHALRACLLATGFPYNIRETGNNNVAQFAAFSVRAQGVRRMGSAVIYLAYVAAGRLDGYWELRLGAWDVAAGALLVEEAGGRISNLEGAPLDLAAPSVVASNGRIHDEMLTVLATVAGRESANG